MGIWAWDGPSDSPPAGTSPFPAGILLVPIFFSGFSQAALSQAVSDTTRVTITGTVVDYSTLEPISGVEISLPELGHSYVSDSSGGFVFENIPLGVHGMELNKDGFIPVQGPLTVARGGSFVVHLRPEGSPEPGSLLGKVVDPASGTPIESAMIGLRGTGLRRMTDADGRFGFIDVPPGSHLLEIEHIGFASRADSVRVVSGRMTEV